MMDLRFIHSADQKTESRVRGLQSSKRFHFSSNKRERFKLSLNSLKRDLPFSFSGPFLLTNLNNNELEFHLIKSCSGVD